MKGGIALDDARAGHWQPICDLVATTISGLWLGLFYGWSRSSGDIHDPDFNRSVVIATATFVGLGVLMLVRRGPNKSRISGWTWTLVPPIGSIFTFIGIVAIPYLSWPFRQGTLMDGIREQIFPLIGSVMIYTVVTLPVMAAFHFLPCFLKKLGHA
jgi:hypothetical protein